MFGILTQMLQSTKSLVHCNLVLKHLMEYHQEIGDPARLAVHLHQFRNHSHPSTLVHCLQGHSEVIYMLRGIVHWYVELQNVHE